MSFKTAVISLGGSIIVPDEVDRTFLKKFREVILSLHSERFIIICGGGARFAEIIKMRREI